MRRKIFFLLFAFIAAMTTSATAATTRIIKVLPHFIDHKGRHSLSPSLYDRDAYQAHLRANPELRSGLRFDVHWKAKTAQHENLTLRVELRGAAEGNLPRQTTLETTVKSGTLGRWTPLTLKGEAYKDFGEVTAWRVTLWDGEKLVGEQKSFLW